MFSFDPDITNVRQIYAQTARQGQLASALIFLIALVAGGALYGLNPSGFFSPANYPALITLSSLGAISVLGLFASMVVHRCVSQPIPKPPAVPIVCSQPSVMPIAPPDPPPIVPPACPQASPPPHLSTSPQVTPLNQISVSKTSSDYLTDLMDGLIDLVVALHAAYYRTEGKRPKKSAELLVALKGLKNLASTIFQDCQQMGRLLLIEALCEINPANLSPYLQRQPIDLIQNLSQLLKDLILSGSQASPIIRYAICAVAQMTEHDWTQDQKFNKLWEKMQQANQKYEKSQQRLCADPSSDARKNDAKKKVAEYCLARTQLFNYLCTSIQLNDLDAWVPLIIPIYLKNHLEVFQYKIPRILIKIFTGHGEKGIFTCHRPLIWGATTTPTITCGLIKEALCDLPLDLHYQTQLVDFTKTLLSLLADPIYYATCIPISNPFSTPQPRPIYEGLKQLFGSNGPEPAKYTSRCRTWQDYLSAYTAYLKVFTTKLNELTHLTQKSPNGEKK
jgi:hypothetical protein